MDFRQITMMQKIKSGMDRFRANHPKFPLFLRAVSQDALVEGSIIEINVSSASVLSSVNVFWPDWLLSVQDFCTPNYYMVFFSMFLFLICDLQTAPR